jgi:hypothetical protein
MFDWRENDAVASLLIERSLRLVENWPTEIVPFVRENKARFRRFRTEYGEHCPRALTDLILGGSNYQHQETRKARSQTARIPVILEGRSRQERVTDVVEYCLQTGKRVSLRATCKAARISFLTLQKDEALRGTVQEAKSQFRTKEERAVKEAVIELRARKVAVSVAAVATYLGRSSKYLSKSPNLLSIVYSARS